MLAESVSALAAIIDIVDRDRSTGEPHAKGEPRLGERGLYPTLSAGVPGGAEAFVTAFLWVLNLSDGTTLAARDRRALGDYLSLSCPRLPRPLSQRPPRGLEPDVVS